MKKLLSLILALAMILPAAALAETDYAALSDEELKAIISACSAELMKRNTSEPEGILLFEYDKVKVYQTGEAYIDFSGYLRIPVSVYNDMDGEMVISVENVTCNGWDIYGGNCRASANAKKKNEIAFKISEADVKAIDQINSLCFSWEVLNYTESKVIYEQEEQEEHRFW